MSEEKGLIIESNIDTKNIVVTPYSVEFVGKPTLDEWFGAFKQVQKIHGMMQFYLGDLIVYAESPVTGWGESKYRDLIEATGYEYNSLARYASVARRFPVEFRKELLENHLDTYPNISFNHFQLAAPLDDVRAAHFLSQVSNNKWTVEKLRSEINNWKDADKRGHKEVPIGYISFKSMAQKMLKGFVPELVDEEYDEKTWLLEMRQWIEERLENLE